MRDRRAGQVDAHHAGGPEAGQTHGVGAEVALQVDDRGAPQVAQPVGVGASVEGIASGSSMSSGIPYPDAW